MDCKRYLNLEMSGHCVSKQITQYIVTISGLLHIILGGGGGIFQIYGNIDN